MGFQVEESTASGERMERGWIERMDRGWGEDG